MSARPLPQGGPERNIFLVGLRRLSDQCEAPELTPECPFYEPTAQGPGCGEQCKDLLAEHVGGHQPEVWQDLGGGLAAIRRPAPRPRRSPAPDLRPFDAAGIGIRDRDRPVEQRRTITLIRDIRDHLATPPAFFADLHERAYVVATSYEELTKRNVDADLMVRCGAATRVEAGVLFSVLAKEILGNAGVPIDDELQQMPEPDPAWRNLLVQARAADKAEDQDLLAYAATGAFGRRVGHWLATATINEVFDWTAPPVADFLALTRPAWTADQVARATWLVERFTETYLEDWTTDSLEMEWGYLHSEHPGCCPPEAMRERPTDVTDVARLLADRHHQEWKQRPTSIVDRQFSATDFTRAAAENLAAGRQDAAAAILAAVLRLSPDSPEANNNYGFCILPTDVARSLGHLEKAATNISEAVELTNAANRVLALHLLGRDDEARALAEHALALPTKATPSYLWTHGSGPLRLTEPISPRDHLEQLYEHLLSETRWDSCRATAE
ncbi:hypothetical protein [Geodermatophilus sp. URMC 64]